MFDYMITFNVTNTYKISEKREREMCAAKARKKCTAKGESEREELQAKQEGEREKAQRREREMHSKLKERKINVQLMTIYEREREIYKERERETEMGSQRQERGSKKYAVKGNTEREDAESRAIKRGKYSTKGK